MLKECCPSGGWALDTPGDFGQEGRYAAIGDSGLEAKSAMKGEGELGGVQSFLPLLTRQTCHFKGDCVNDKVWFLLQDLSI